MPKRTSRVETTPAVTRIVKQNRNEPHPITVVSGLYVEGKIAITRCLLKELKSASVIASDLEAGRRVLPKGATSFEVTQYTTETPRPLPPQSSFENVVVLCHDLARPSRVAEEMTKEGRTARLVAVLDARSFLDEWESSAKLPLNLRHAGKKDGRAHLHDKKVCEVLAEFVESADVIALCHTDESDADELEMLESMLHELNPSAAVVRRTGDGASGGKFLGCVVQLAERPAPGERGGCWQALLAARRRDLSGNSDEAEETLHEETERKESDDEGDDESDDESDDEGEGEDDDEGEEEGEEEQGEKEEEWGGEGEEGGEEADDEWTAPVLGRFTFLARRPFHPARLHKLLKRGRLEGVIRSRGRIWVATHPEDAILWNQVSKGPGPLMNAAQAERPAIH